MRDLARRRSHRSRIVLAWASLLWVVIVMLPTTAGALDPPPTDGPDEPELVVFHGEGCPHCARELAFLVGLGKRWPDLEIVTYEVWHDETNEALFRRYASAHDVEADGVPTTFLAGRTWIGFSEVIGRDIEAAVAALDAGNDPLPTTSTDIEVPGLGTVDVGSRSLLVATLLIGFADGMNPCSLWALSILLALVLHSGSRRRVLVVGTAFLAVTSALYGVYLIGAYSALDYASEMTWIRAAVAAVAGGFGLVHLRAYLTERPSALSIPDARKPTLYRRMRFLADPDRSLPAVLGGTVILAAGVSLLETPCSAGLPLLWTDMLAAQDVSGVGAALLFSVYLGVFLLDELVLFLVAVLTLRAAKLQERHGRALQLVSGSLMTTLAATMVLAPEYLETVPGTLAVLGAAGLLACVLAAVHTMESGRATDRPPVDLSTKG
mgnify:CR=1 FL=1